MRKAVRGREQNSEEGEAVKGGGRERRSCEGRTTKDGRKKGKRD